MRAWFGNASALVPALVAAVVLPAVLTRRLEPAEFGRYAVTIGFATLAATFLYGWIVVALGRLLPGVEAPLSHEITRTAWRLTIAGSFLGLVGGCAVWFAGAAAIGGGVAAGALLSPLNVAIGEAKARQQVRRFVGLSALQAGAQLVAAVIAAFYATSGVTVAVTASAGSALVAAPFIRAGGAKPLIASVRADFLRVGAPYLPTALALTVLAVGDRLIIARRLGEVQTALYAAVFSLMFRPMSLFTQIAQTVVVPEASRRANRNTLQEGEALWFRAFVPVVGLAIAGGVLLYACQEIVLLVLDPPYRNPPRSLVIGAIGSGVAYLVYSMASIRAVLRRMTGVNAIAVGGATVVWTVVNLLVVRGDDDLAIPAVTLGVAYLTAAAVSAALVRLRTPVGSSP